MEFQELVKATRRLEFIPDEATATSAVKAVLGILASRLEEPEAHALTDYLPEPLTYDCLRGHQAHPTHLDTDRCVRSLARQFHVSTDQARELLRTVLHTAKLSLPEEKLGQIEHGLPYEWQVLLRAL